MTASSHSLMSTQRLFPAVCNVVTDDLPPSIPSEGADLILCMFVLSAISPKVWMSKDLLRVISLLTLLRSFTPKFSPNSPTL
jgi:hypothetical protein